MLYNGVRFYCRHNENEANRRNIMSVHKAISEHSSKQQKALQDFLELDHKREEYIEEAIQKCKNNEPFTVDKINEITRKINDLAIKEIVPTRKLVTIKMVKGSLEK
jgi:hemerythrin superfamily protein